MQNNFGNNTKINSCFKHYFLSQRVAKFSYPRLAIILWMNFFIPNFVLLTTQSVRIDNIISRLNNFCYNFSFNGKWSKGWLFANYSIQYVWTIFDHMRPNSFWFDSFDVYSYCSIEISVYLFFKKLMIQFNIHEN